MRNLIPFLIFVLMVMIFSACVNNKEEVLYPNVSNSCDTTNITFEAKVAPIFSANCLSCHGNDAAAANGGGVRLQDYVDVKSHIDRIYGSISHQTGYIPMPKNMTNTIDKCQIKIVQIWIQKGALNN